MYYSIRLPFLLHLFRLSFSSDLVQELIVQESLVPVIRPYHILELIQ